MWLRYIAPCLLLVTPAAADTYVFLGDSITQGIRSEAAVVTAEQRFSFLIAQDRQCREVNAGVPSDTTAGMVERFANDVAANAPSLLVIMTENDTWPDFKITVEMSEANLRRIIREAQKTKARLVLMTPPPIRASSEHPKTRKQVAVERQHIAMQRRLAAGMGVQLVDVHAALSALRASDRAAFDRLYMDPWHLTAEGHRFVAAMFMAAWPLH